MGFPIGVGRNHGTIAQGPEADNQAANRGPVGNIKYQEIIRIREA
jgi:hypothetical protein